MDCGRHTSGWHMLAAWVRLESSWKEAVVATGIVTVHLQLSREQMHSHWMSQSLDDQQCHPVKAPPLMMRTSSQYTVTWQKEMCRCRSKSIFWTCILNKRPAGLFENVCKHLHAHTSAHVCTLTQAHTGTHARIRAHARTCRLVHQTRA